VVADRVGPDRGGDFALARFKPNGSVDTSFGVGGRLFTDLGGFDVPLGVVRQPDDKLLVVGISRPSISGSSQAVAMVRYNPDSSLDSSFGAGGKVLTSPGGRSYAVSGPTLQANGDIVLGGTSRVGVGDAVATLVRFLANGSVDLSFGASGVVLYNSSPNDIDYFGPAVLAPGNKLVTTLNSAQFSAGLARFNGGWQLRLDLRLGWRGGAGAPREPTGPRRDP